MLDAAITRDVARLDFARDVAQDRWTATWLGRMRSLAPSALADQDLYPAIECAAEPGVAISSLRLRGAVAAIADALVVADARLLAYGAFVAFAARHTYDHEICVGTRYANATAIQPFLPVGVGVPDRICINELMIDLADRLAYAPRPDAPILDLEAIAAPKPWRTRLAFGVTLTDHDPADMSATSSDPTVHLIIGPGGDMELRLAPTVDLAYGSILEDRFAAFCAALAAAPARDLADLPTMTDIEQNRVVHEFNDTHAPYAYDGGLIARMEAAAAATPNQKALVFKDVELDFRTFNTRVNRLARQLKAAGVGKDRFVCLCLDRSIEMVVAIWATLKAGGAYVPLNVDDPEQRIREIIADSAPVAILTQTSNVQRFADQNAAVIDLEAFDWTCEPEDEVNPDACAAANDLAYMIYTSGSTGKPKGVVIEHGAILNRIAWMQDAFGLTSSDRVLQKTPYTFDVSVWEFLWAPTFGAGVVIAEPGGHMAPGYMLGLIAEAGVTHVHFVPSVLRIFLMMPGLDKLPLKQMFCSGEALPLDLQERFHEVSPAELHNLYGPTEAAVDVSHWACRRDAGDVRVPIGKPIANVGLYVLDRHNQPVPIGATGELHIGGVNLARGYWARPDITAERFVASSIPNAAHPRLYRTGDLARFLPCGAIEYLGRNDFQVKVHGIRIELGEIENVIRTHETVQDIVVAAEGEGPAKHLVAYTVVDEVIDNLHAVLEAHAGARLPDYMIPRETRILSKMPLSVSGKTDRKRLNQVYEAEREAAEHI